MAKKHRIGESNMLCDVKFISECFKCTPRASTRLLKVLRIPIIHIAKDRYFNFYSFEKVMFFITRHGGKGFASPGSSYKALDRKHKDGKTPFEITDEDMKAMQDPLFIAEFECAGTKKNKAGIVGAYVREAQGRRTEKNKELMNKQ